MSRKGVSAQEKKKRMLDLFYEKKSFFQLKELEKIAPKEKGIIANSVKDVVQSLVDEGVIDTDKIGTSIYFWAFPGKVLNSKKRKLEDITNKYKDCSKKLKLATETVEKSKEGKENSAEKRVLLDKIIDLQIEKDEVLKQLKKYEDNDPVALEKMNKEIEDIKNAANRWTDNIMSIKHWCKEKFFMEDSVLDKQFGIPENFDYID